MDNRDQPSLLIKPGATKPRSLSAQNKRWASQFRPQSCKSHALEKSARRSPSERCELDFFEPASASGTATPRSDDFRHGKRTSMIMSEQKKNRRSESAGSSVQCAYASNCVTLTNYPRNDDGTNFEEQPPNVPDQDVIVALVTVPGDSVSWHSGLAPVFCVVALITPLTTPIDAM